MNEEEDLEELEKPQKEMGISQLVEQWIEIRSRNQT